MTTKLKTLLKDSYLFQPLLFLVILFIYSCQQKQDAESGKAEEKIALDLQTLRSGYVKDTMWTQAYIAGIPGEHPELVVTMSQKLGSGIDNYGNLYYSTSNDLGKTWSEVHLLMERTKIGDSIEVVLSDLYPSFHEQTKTVLGTGKTFFYQPENEEDPEVGRAVGYTIFNPETREWSEIKTFKFPEEDHSGMTVYNPSAGCNQRFDLPNGEILLPVYYLRKNSPEGKNITTIVKCAYDGNQLTYLEHGSELTIPKDRGFGETSIAFLNGEYFITIRADHSAYVAKSTDGLNYPEPIEWQFDDGEWLGNYNTQQHWVTAKNKLYLVYTRKGANNDHIFRHRAPLFMAEVDTKTLKVKRSTEKIVVPERGARLGNFGIAQVDENTTVISVAERMTAISESHGADNSVFVSRIFWKNMKD